MDQQFRKIHRSKTTSNAFLLSRSEPCGPRPDYGPDTDQSSQWMINTLSGTFPGIIFPQRLEEEVQSRLGESEGFAAMILQFDDPELSGDPETAVLETAEELERACKDRAGFWGVYGEASLACFLPGDDTSACLEVFGMISEKLSQQGNDTVTAGMACYPQLDFTREQTLVNARKALEHAEFFGPGSSVVFDSVSLNISGDKYYQAGDLDGAEAEFKKALALDPANVNVLNSLGVCYGVRGKFDSALECFNQAFDHDASEAMAVYNAGYVYLCRQNYDQALELFLKAERLDGSLFEAAFQAGRIMAETRRHEEARKHLEKAVKLNPESGAAFRYLGDCYAALDRDADASAAYKTALKLRPDNTDALSALGFLYEVQGRNADIALMFCRRAVEICPENGLFRHRLGRLFYNRAMYEEARAEFEAAKACGHQESEEYAEMLRTDNGKKENIR